MGIETALIVGGTLLSSYSAVQQGQQANRVAKRQGEQAEADAEAERGAARVHADNIRKAAESQRSAARAASAASGLDVGAPGTPLVINDQITEDSEHDAFLSLIGGDNAVKRGRATAQGYRAQGKDAMNAGYMNAASSVLAGGAQYGRASGWKVTGSRAKTKPSSALNTYSDTSFA